MSDVRLEVRGLKELQKKLTKEAIQQPFSAGIKKITLALQREVTAATPVDTGRLKASVTPKLTQENGIFQGLVGTNVQYAPYVEYGTKKMEARHLEHGSAAGLTGKGAFAAMRKATGRVYGEGMFSYGLKRVKEKMSEYLKEIGVIIEQRWNK